MQDDIVKVGTRNTVTVSIAITNTAKLLVILMPQLLFELGNDAEQPMSPSSY